MTDDLRLRAAAAPFMPPQAVEARNVTAAADVVEIFDSFCGVPVVNNPSLPHGCIAFIDRDGRIIGGFISTGKIPK